MIADFLESDRDHLPDCDDDDPHPDCWCSWDPDDQGDQPLMMNHAAEFERLAGQRIEKVISWSDTHVRLRLSRGNELEITAGVQPTQLVLKFLPGGRMPVPGEKVEVLNPPDALGRSSWRELEVGYVADTATPVWFQALTSDGGNVQLFCYQEGEAWRRPAGVIAPPVPAGATGVIGEPPVALEGEQYVPKMGGGSMGKMLAGTPVAVDGGVAIRFREPKPPGEVSE
jgi:hypothetical protein